MSRPRLRQLIACLFVAMLAVGPAAADEAADEQAEPVSFRADIAPILLQRCQGCHGPREQEGGYRLDTFDHLVEAEGDYPIVAAGDPEDSELYLLVTDPEPEFRMPADADPLPNEQIELIRRWIAEGAEFDGDDRDASLAQIIPAPEHPSAPEAYPAPVPIGALAFSPDGAELAVGGYHEVTIWDVETGELARRIGNVPRRVHAIAWSPDGGTLAVGGGRPGESGELRLFDAAEGTLLGVPIRTGDLILAAAFSPVGDRIATGGADGVIRVIGAEAGGVLLELTEHSDWVMAVRFDAAGERLASASRDETAKVYDARSGETLTTYRDHDAQVFDVDFRSDGKQVVSVAADGQLAVWRAEDGERQGRTQPLSQPLQRLIVHDDHALTAAADGGVRLHRVGDREEVRRYEGATDWLFALAHHADMGRIAAAGYDGRVTIWNFEDETPSRQFLAAPGYEE